MRLANPLSNPSIITARMSYFLVKEIGPDAAPDVIHLNGNQKVTLLIDLQVFSLVGYEMTTV